MNEVTYSSRWMKRGDMFLKKWFGLALASLLMSACAGENPIREPFEPKPPELQESGIKPAPGSLYAGYDNLFSDDKAYQVGDTITIKIAENISGSGSANTKSNRKSGLDLGFSSPTIMGEIVPSDSPIFSFQEESGNDFQGKGDTNRKAQLIAMLTARVIKVYPNGNLYIAGKKQIRINNDSQLLTISGIVKPTNIEQDNSVLSSKISDMYVEYNGEGFMADNQRPGWLSQFLIKIWPF